MTKRAATYTRRDTLGRQQQMCEEWAAANDYAVVRTYATDGPGDGALLTELKADLASGTFDCVVASTEETYSRVSEPLVDLVRAAQDADVEVCVVASGMPLTGRRVGVLELIAMMDGEERR